LLSFLQKADRITVAGKFLQMASVFYGQHVSEIFSNQLSKFILKNTLKPSWQIVFFVMNLYGNSGHKNTFSFTGSFSVILFF